MAMRDAEVKMRHRAGCKNRVVSIEGRIKQGEAQRKRFERDGAPMLGKHQSEETRKLLSKKNVYDIVEGKRAGACMDFYNGRWFRSKYDAAVAHQLDEFGLKWVYEGKAIDLGDRWYVPDFEVENKIFLEVKCAKTSSGYWKAHRMKGLGYRMRVVVPTWMSIRTALMNEGVCSPVVKNGVCLEVR